MIEPPWIKFANYSFSGNLFKKRVYLTESTKLPYSQSPTPYSKGLSCKDPDYLWRLCRLQAGTGNGWKVPNWPHIQDLNPINKHIYSHTHTCIHTHIHTHRFWAQNFTFSIEVEQLFPAYLLCTAEIWKKHTATPANSELSFVRWCHLSLETRITSTSSIRDRPDLTAKCPTKEKEFGRIPCHQAGSSALFTNLESSRDSSAVQTRKDGFTNMFLKITDDFKGLCRSDVNVPCSFFKVHKTSASNEFSKAATHPGRDYGHLVIPEAYMRLYEEERIPDHTRGIKYLSARRKPVAGRQTSTMPQKSEMKRQLKRRNPILRSLQTMERGRNEADAINGDRLVFKSMSFGVNESLLYHLLILSP